VRKHPLGALSSAEPGWEDIAQAVDAKRHTAFLATSQTHANVSLKELSRFRGVHVSFEIFRRSPTFPLITFYSAVQAKRYVGKKATGAVFEFDDSRTIIGECGEERRKLAHLIDEGNSSIDALARRSGGALVIMVTW
jgi:hypothetical protein